MEAYELMQQRHSVRTYTDRRVEVKVRATLDSLVAEINEKAGLNIQTIYDDEKCFDSFMAHYGKFSGVRNYIALVGKKAPDLDEKLGYYGEQLVLSAQELGLNTCWVALTHGKSRAVCDKGERCVCLIALGYGAVCGVPHKSRPMSELCRHTGEMPDWFRRGMEAAMTAPTAMNQQKFCFELSADGSVHATCGKGFYTKLDLGIVRYHFEKVTGVKTRH